MSFKIMKRTEVAMLAIPLVSTATWLPEPLTGLAQAGEVSVQPSWVPMDKKDVYQSSWTLGTAEQLTRIYLERLQALLLTDAARCTSFEHASASKMGGPVDPNLHGSMFVRSQVDTPIVGSNVPLQFDSDVGDVWDERSMGIISREPTVASGYEIAQSQRVEFRNAGHEWEAGVVVSTSPLMVVPDDGSNIARQPLLVRPLKASTEGPGQSPLRGFKPVDAQDISVLYNEREDTMEVLSAHRRSVLL